VQPQLIVSFELFHDYAAYFPFSAMTLLVGDRKGNRAEEIGCWSDDSTGALQGL